MKHGSELLGELGELKKDEVFFRTHSLLSTGKGEHRPKWGSTNAYTEDAAGNPVWIGPSWTASSIPIAEKGVRPSALCADRFHAAGAFHEARAVSASLSQFEIRGSLWRLGVSAEGLREVGRACVSMGEALPEKYGEKEVLHWYWQTWNRSTPTIGKERAARIFKLHDHAIRAVRRAIPGAKVGGPDLAQGKGGDFLEDLYQSLPEGHRPGQQQERHAVRLHLLPCQRQPEASRWPRAHGDLQPAQ